MSSGRTGAALQLTGRRRWVIEGPTSPATPDPIRRGGKPRPARSCGTTRPLLVQAATTQPVGRLRRVQTPRPPVQPRQMLPYRRLADAELVRRRRHGPSPDVRPQDLDLAACRLLLRHQSALRYTAGHDLAAEVTFSSTNRGRKRRWGKLALPLSPRPFPPSWPDSPCPGPRSCHGLSQQAEPRP